MGTIHGHALWIRSFHFGINIALVCHHSDSVNNIDIDTVGFLGLNFVVSCVLLYRLPIGDVELFLDQMNAAVSNVLVSFP